MATRKKAAHPEKFRASFSTLREETKDSDAVTHVLL